MEILDRPRVGLSDTILSPIRNDPERFPFSFLFPLAAIFLHYTFLFPSMHLFHVFFPLLFSLVAFLFWFVLNQKDLGKLHLRKQGMREAVIKGVWTGVGLALFNLFVILKLTVWLGYSYDFLRQTPHARLPFWIVFPFGILLIAFMVEVIFRGWILGRLWILLEKIRGGASLSIFFSALFFSYDPFMVAYFKGYHWLALIDGMIWGRLLLKTGNLSSTVAAHAVEVWIVYFVLKIVYA